MLGTGEVLVYLVEYKLPPAKTKLSSAADYCGKRGTGVKLNKKMEIQQRDDGKKGAFYIEHENDVVAEMTYIWAGADKIIIDHTDVKEVLKGKGAGRQMVARAVSFARERGIKIIPLCPFAKSVFDKVKEFSDVL